MTIMTTNTMMTILMIIIAGGWMSLQHKGGSILAMASTREFNFENRNTVKPKQTQFESNRNIQIQSKTHAN